MFDNNCNFQWLPLKCNALKNKSLFHISNLPYSLPLSYVENAFFPTRGYNNDSVDGRKAICLDAISTAVIFVPRGPAFPANVWKRSRSVPHPIDEAYKCRGFAKKRITTSRECRRLNLTKVPASQESWKIYEIPTNLRRYRALKLQVLGHPKCGFLYEESIDPICWLFR